MFIDPLGRHFLEPSENTKKIHFFYFGICPKIYKMAASNKPKLSKTPLWGPRSGPKRGILLSLAYLRLPFCIFWTYSKVKEMYFFVFSEGSKKCLPKGSMNISKMWSIGQCGRLVSSTLLQTGKKWKQMHFFIVGSFLNNWAFRNIILGLHFQDKH